MNETSHFVWGEIKLPSPYYLPNLSFAEGFSISKSGAYIVGTFGLRPPDPAKPPPPFSGNFHGFIKASSGSPGGQITGQPSLDLFGSVDFTSNPSGATSARGINDDRDIVGFYRNETKEIHGYVWPNGEANPRPFDFSPNRLEQVFFKDDDPELHNAVLGINNEKIVVGVCRVKVNGVDFGMDIGLVAPMDNPDRLVSIDIGGSEALDLRAAYLRLRPPIDVAINTRANAINSKREIVGSFTDLSGIRGFKWALDMQCLFDGNPPLFVGRPDTIDIHAHPPLPFPSLPPLRFPTIVNGINDDGTIVGTYATYDGIEHGFVWKPETDLTYSPGKHVTIDIVGATHTVVSGISDNGVFVGYYRGNNIGGRHVFAGYLL